MLIVASAILSSVSVTCDHVKFDLYNCEENTQVCMCTCVHVCLHTHTHTHMSPKGRQYFLDNKEEETFLTDKAEHYIITQSIILLRRSFFSQASTSRLCPGIYQTTDMAIFVIPTPGRGLGIKGPLPLLIPSDQVKMLGCTPFCSLDCR